MCVWGGGTVSVRVCVGGTVSVCVCVGGGGLGLVVHTIM